MTSLERHELITPLERVLVEPGRERQLDEDRMEALRERPCPRDVHQARPASTSAISGRTVVGKLVALSDS